MEERLDAIYITYWSLRDPLCQSQSLPYLRSLAARDYRIGLITFEQGRWRLGEQERAAMRDELRSEGIDWHPLTYHKRPAVLSTLFDIGVGSLAVANLARRSGAKFIHGRSSVSCGVAAVAAKLSGSRLFADADGPLSQEYVDAGVWKAGSIGHRLTAWGERKFIESADVVAVLSRHRESEVSRWVRNPPVYVLPCAVDLDRFRPLPEERQRVRQELGLEGTVFVYVGKTGGWYDTDGMLRFLEVASKTFAPLTLLVLTREDTEPLEARCRERGISLVARAADPTEVPRYLSASDVGLCFRHRYPSQRSCSPIKSAEYLACGLPVVSSSGCGDYDELIPREGVGVVVPESSDDAYRESVASLRQLLDDPGLGQRCRATAEQFLGLEEVVAPRYAEIYERLSSVER